VLTHVCAHIHASFLCFLVVITHTWVNDYINGCSHTCVLTCVFPLSAPLIDDIHVCSHSHVCSHTCVLTYMCAHIHVCSHSHVCSHTCMRAHMCAQIRISIICSLTVMIYMCVNDCIKKKWVLSFKKNGCFLFKKMGAFFRNKWVLTHMCDHIHAALLCWTAGSTHRGALD